MRRIGRDAGTGRFVPIRTTVKRPKTTVVETVKPCKPKKK